MLLHGNMKVAFKANNISHFKLQWDPVKKVMPDLPNLDTDYVSAGTNGPS